MAYIEKELIIDFIQKGLNNPDKEKAYGHEAIEILAEIEFAPTADVQEVRHGRWETIPDHSQALTSYRHICSECKIVYKGIRPYGHNYCPDCGAKMDGGSNET